MENVLKELWFLFYNLLYFIINNLGTFITAFLGFLSALFVANWQLKRGEKRKRLQDIEYLNLLMKNACIAWDIQRINFIEFIENIKTLPFEQHYCTKYLYVDDIKRVKEYSCQNLYHAYRHFYKKSTAEEYNEIYRSIDSIFDNTFSTMELIREFDIYSIKERNKADSLRKELFTLLWNASRTPFHSSSSPEILEYHKKLSETFINNFQPEMQSDNSIFYEKILTPFLDIRPIGIVNLPPNYEKLNNLISIGWETSANLKLTTDHYAGVFEYNVKIGDDAVKKLRAFIDKNKTIIE